MTQTYLVLCVIAYLVREHLPAFLVTPALFAMTLAFLGNIGCRYSHGRSRSGRTAATGDLGSFSLTM